MFSGIGWGGSEVLQQNLQQAAALGWSPQLLRYQSDLDRIDDMAPGMARPDPSDRSNWSVVIPVLQEAQQLPSLLAQLQGPEEVWVVDGGSRDGSGQIARLMGAHWLRSGASRGAQLRLGAAQATRPWLLFLHADAVCQATGPRFWRRRCVIQR